MRSSVCDVGSQCCNGAVYSLTEELCTGLLVSRDASQRQECVTVNMIMIMILSHIPIPGSLHLSMQHLLGGFQSGWHTLIDVQMHPHVRDCFHWACLIVQQGHVQ